MADYSHLPSLIYKPELIARLEGRGERVSDEILLEIFNRISPPLLASRETAVVVAILTRKHGRRPCRGVPSMRWLSRRIARLDRNDVDQSFIRALSDRIAAASGYTEFERSLRFYKAHERPRRDMVIKHLFRDFYGMIEGNPTTIQHEILGELSVPHKTGTRREQAAELTRQVLQDRLDIISPAVPTIIKIASSKRH